jgi:hypothetical protein
MGDEEQAQAGGGAGGEMQEITVVIGGLVCQGVVKVVAGRQRVAMGGGRKAGARTPQLGMRAVEALTDAGFKLGEVVEALSGRCAVPRRTVSDIKRRIRARRKSMAVVEQAVRAAKERQAQADAAAKEERERQEVEAVSAAAREMRQVAKAQAAESGPDDFSLRKIARSFDKWGQEG